MSGRFGGFSQDDINKIQSGSQNKENVKTTLRPALKRVEPIASKLAAPKEPPTPARATVPAPDAPQDDINTSSSINTTTSDNSMQDALHFKPLPHTNYGRDDAPEKPINEDNIQPLTKGITLRDFEQFRMIEEQNKHKKAMLYKAIDQQAERTSAEARKLADLKQELSKLESDLAVDVSILRKEIDKASLKYMQAQTHFTQVECAYLKAQLELQKAREMKDLFAGHLNVIIAHNENRKAHKLAALMAQVGLDSHGLAIADHSRPEEPVHSAQSTESNAADSNHQVG